MKPLTLHFIEKPTTDEIFDFSQIEYDTKLNLSVNKSTRKPAIDELQFATETFTRVTGEGTDTDSSNNIGLIMATETATKVRVEESDSDPSIIGMMETRTNTFNMVESSDSDK